MILMSEARFLEECEKFGADPDRARNCIVKTEWGTHYCDPNHPDYPIQGPGTELRKILSSLGFESKDGCGCELHEYQMNLLGPDGCLEQITNLVEKLRESHAQAEYTIPFSATAAKALIRIAIRRARALAK